MSTYIIAIDQGTSSCRAMLIDAEGAIIGVEQQEFTQIFPQSDWVEHDPLEIWDVQMKVLDQLITKHVNDLTTIQGIGITNQRETTVVWNKHTGEPVYNAIVWQDKRTSDYCKKLRREGFEEYTVSNMGLPLDPYFSGTKLRWILNETTENPDDLLFGTIDTWLIWKMTEGQSHVTDYTNASRTLLFNIRTLEWDKKALNQFGIPDNVLPQVQESASHFGVFKFQDVEIPITGVAGDQQAALFGQACFHEGMAKNTYGTGCFMLMNVGAEFVSSQNGLLTTLCCDAEGKVAYALEGSIFVAGAAIQWLRDGLEIISDSKESEALAESVRTEHDVIVVPAFAGLGAPYWNMDSRGAIFGLTRATGKAQLAKATLDSLAYRTKDVLAAMAKDSKITLDVLKVDGGASNNNYLMQFQADVLQAEVERPKNIESTAMGVAYLAGITLGIWDSETIVKNRAIDKVFSPQLSADESARLYKQWQKAISRTLDWKKEDTDETAA